MLIRVSGDIKRFFFGGTMKHYLLLALILITGFRLTAQSTQIPNSPQGLTNQPNQTDNPLMAESRRVYQAVSTNLLKAAQEMPDNLYAYKPVGTSRTFGDLIEHIARVQRELCNNLNGKHPENRLQSGSKEGRIKDLSGSIGDCDSAFAELSAQNANVMVQAPAGRVTHLAALEYIITHASEEYGQLTMYLRLNHLMPPTSDEPSGGSAGKAGSQ
jgi:uncharacterized damage-inducible protein DinB